MVLNDLYKQTSNLANILENGQYNLLETEAEKLYQMIDKNEYLLTPAEIEGFNQLYFYYERLGRVYRNTTMN